MAKGVLSVPTQPERQPHAAAGTLRVRGLTLELAGRRIVDDVSLTASPGQLIGLIGPNGAGKTTLLRLIAGLLCASAGTVTLGPIDLQRLPRQAIARRVAHVPQTPTLPVAATCLDVVLMGRTPYLGRFQWESHADIAIAYDAMRLVEAVPFAERPIAELSGGERQRVFLARALAQEPAVLLCDEPTANLDVWYQIRLLEQLRELARSGLIVIAAIHDLNLAARFCDRLILLRAGRIVADGAPASVLTPTNLRAAFGVRAAVRRDPLTDGLTVTILADAADDPGAPRAHVHVIGGGGQTASLLEALQRAGYRVSTGVLAENDTDYLAAQGLGIETIAIPPFTPIDAAAERQNAALAARADVVVLGDIPFGHGNLPNLTSAEHARCLVIVEGRTGATRDFTGGIATARLEALARRAIVVAPADVLATIGRLVVRPPACEPQPVDEQTEDSNVRGT